MNVIRCDLPEYLIWKWRPENQDLNSTTRENSIRYGSSLRVKDGEVAVFFYKQKNGTMQDFIVGPYDDTIKTANFPVLASLVGLAFGGESPFQAEIYFINLSGVVQIKFAIPYFDVADPRFVDYVVPVCAGGTITFNIQDYRSFIKLHRLINFELEEFKQQIKDAVVRRIKNCIANAPADYGIPLVQIERRLEDINDRIAERLRRDLEEDFGVNMRRLDLSRIEPDKDSEGWQELRAVTADLSTQTIKAQNEVNIKNLQEMQAINAENMAESLRIQREESQRAQRLTSESQFIAAHALNLQADVLGTAAENMGGAAMGGQGFNPAMMMTGLAVGGAMGNQMAGMVNNIGNSVNAQQAQQSQQTPPPPPLPQQASYMVIVGGNQSGPYNMQQLAQLVAAGHLTPQSYVWKQGMPQWAEAGTIPELQCLFAPPAPPMPPSPPSPPTPPTPPVI